MRTAVAGRSNLASMDVVGPVAIALAVVCETGPCDYDLSLDVDPEASENDVIGSWPIENDSRSPAPR